MCQLLSLTFNVNNSVFLYIISIWLQFSKVHSCWHGYTVCYCPCPNSRTYCPLMTSSVSLSDSCPLLPTKDSSQSTNRLASFPWFPLMDFTVCHDACFQKDCHTCTHNQRHSHTRTQSLSHVPPLFIDKLSSTCVQDVSANCNCACCVCVYVWLCSFHPAWCLFEPPSASADRLAAAFWLWGSEALTHPLLSPLIHKSAWIL